LKRARFWLQVVAVMILLLAAVGCSSKSAVPNAGPSNGQKGETQTNTADQKAPSELRVTPEDEMGWGTDDDDEGDGVIPPLDGEAALKLREEGVTRFFTVFYDGGKKCKPLEERQIGDDPLGYYFFCDDMNTKDKIKEYLEPSYADALITEWVDSEMVVQQGGKLAYMPYDVGALTDWEKAKLSRVVEDKGSTKVFEYDVPEAEGESRLIQVPFIYENQKWKLNAHPVDFL